jgi:hypothetical protein
MNERKIIIKIINNCIKRLFLHEKSQVENKTLLGINNFSIYALDFNKT